jgi:hypothetical protein
MKMRFQGLIAGISSRLAQRRTAGLGRSDVGHSLLVPSGRILKQCVSALAGRVTFGAD